MSKLCMESVKDKCETGVNTVRNAIETSKDVSIHPKFSASFSVKSMKNGTSYCDKKVKYDKEITLYNIICAVLAVIGAFAAAAVIIDSVFSMFSCKNKCCKKAKKEEPVEEEEF